MSPPIQVENIMSLEQQHQQMMTAMAQRLAMLEQQVLKANVNAKSGANKPAIPTPKAFSGEVMSVSGGAVDEWIDDIERQFRHHAEYFTNDKRALDYAVNYLSGKAAGWWKSTQDERKAKGRLIVTWEEMKTELRERFQPVEASQVARMALDRMVQKGNVSSYTEYFYKQMTYIKDMSIADQLHVYIRGLKPNIKGEVMKGKPETIQDVVNLASKAEAWLNMTLPGSRERMFTPNNYRSAASSSSSSVPMELGNINQSDENVPENDDASSVASSNISDMSLITPREHQLLALLRDMKMKESVQQSIHAMFKPSASSSPSSNNNKNRRGGNSSNKLLVPNVSREEFTRCWKNRLCLNCKQPGHMARDCKSEYLKF